MIGPQLRWLSEYFENAPGPEAQASDRFASHSGTQVASRHPRQFHVVPTSPPNRQILHQSSSHRKYPIHVRQIHKQIDLCVSILHPHQWRRVSGHQAISTLVFKLWARIAKSFFFRFG
jgi:hypothetical protein